MSASNFSPKKEVSTNVNNTSQFKEFLYSILNGICKALPFQVYTYGISSIITKTPQNPITCGIPPTMTNTTNTINTTNTKELIQNPLSFSIPKIQPLPVYTSGIPPTITNTANASNTTNTTNTANASNTTNTTNTTNSSNTTNTTNTTNAKESIQNPLLYSAPKVQFNQVSLSKTNYIKSDHIFNEYVSNGGGGWMTKNHDY